MKAKDIELPDYTLAQELWNSISHGLGTIFTLIMGPFLIMKAVNSGDVYQIVSSSIFVFALLCLYTFSCLYHGMGRNTGKKVLRVMDHDMVFVLIMGTYVPYCLVSLREYSPAWGYTILSLCVVLGIIGIVLNSVNIKKFAVFSMIDYILMGWIIVISIYPLIKAIGFYPGTFLLILGGVLYTVGAVLYGVGKKKSPWWHTVFHFFVLAGTLCMFFSIYNCVIG
ncbi:MAG: hemolysin III family protein [Bacilli bacterium]|jgi:hemolysin III|nr:hemolysin III family protein [Bacilli bacterium]MCH4210774.1 hemolysin III family protein [Bacilli bacterium]MCH4229098.1 hemolysin III family protein [Bacilli bacterium]MCH4277952.1 hemolysin III family protein [Bacilli bacterium]